MMHKRYNKTSEHRPLTYRRNALTLQRYSAIIGVSEEKEYERVIKKVYCLL